MKFPFLPKNVPSNSSTDFASLLDRLDEDALRLLHQKTRERLRLIRSGKDLKALAHFSVNDRVCFKHYDKMITGTIVRINRKTATLIEDGEHHQWNVSPSLLKKIVTPET